ncbi:hypothetical protein ACRYCC_22285 [Actinomadura scrupuli]|uniref:hypothetical protein n=1 Tax=Actinomadura scrupuli TaxID=559629 RepID=UPI003D990510
MPRNTQRGVLITWNALAVAGIILAGVTVGVLVFLAPAIGVPLGAGVAVSGLLYTLFVTWPDRDA